MDNRQTEVIASVLVAVGGGVEAECSRDDWRIGGGRDRSLGIIHGEADKDVVSAGHRNIEISETETLEVEPL